MAPAPKDSRYRGIINFQGIPVGIEVPEGGVNPHSGKRVSVSYGDIPGTKGVDGDPVDVILGSSYSSQSVFVLQDAHSSDSDSPGEPKQYGEDKVALGFSSEKDARAAWADYYSGDNRAIVGCLVTTVRAIREHLVENTENRGMPFEVCGGANRFLAMTVNKSLSKGGPYIGKRGGKWADPEHTIPFGYGGELGGKGHVKALQDHLAAHHGVKVSLSHSRGTTTVNTVVVPKDRRGQGAGDAVMHAVKRHADAHGHRITLTAENPENASKGKTKLKQWYKRHGFVENKGRNKDYEVSEGMYRDPKAGISKAIVAHDLTKAEGPKPPPGFTPVEKSKKGGYRKKKASGSGYSYWYPGEHKLDDHPDWVEDISKPRGTSEIDPGHFVEVAGRAGLFVYVPDAGGEEQGYTHVVPYDPAHDRASGEGIRVRESNVIPLKGKTKKRIEEPRTGGKPKPPRRPQPPRRPTPPRAGPRRQPKPDQPPPNPEDADAPWSEESEYAEVFHESRAKEGTVLHKLENGVYPLFTIKDSGSRRKSSAVWVPKSDQAALLQEFKPLIHASARTSASSYGVPIFDESQHETADFEDIKAGAALGLVLALRNYRGGKPFAALASDYVNTYAVAAAREALQGGGPGVPRKTMRLIHGFIAAKHRATKAEGETPSAKAIARHWSVKKSDALKSHQKVGVYHDGENVIDQSKEQLPFEDWHVRGPDGEELGDPLPGKESMQKHLTAVIRGQHVHDSQWLDQNPQADPIASLPPELPVGTQLHLRREIDDILSVMESSGPKGAKQAEALSLMFGLGLDAKDYQGSGRAGMALTSTELANKLGLGEPGDSDRTIRYKGTQAKKEAIAAFKKMAVDRRAESRKHADRMLGSADEDFFSENAADGPSHKELQEKYGHDESAVEKINAEIEKTARKKSRLGDNSPQGRQLSSKIRSLQDKAESLTNERVRIASAGIRSGKGKEVEAILLKEKQGTATIEEKRKVRQLYHEQRDRERLEWFNINAKTVPTESESVSEGTSSDSDWLYTDSVMGGYLRASAKRGESNWGPPKFDGKPSAMSEDELSRFMGRQGKRPSREEERQRYQDEVSGASRRSPTEEEIEETDKEQRTLQGGNNG